MREITRIKCAIIGDPAVGKTAITQMLISEGSKFPKSYNLTFGVELSSKYLELEENNQTYELLIYDSSGHDIYTDFLAKVWQGVELVLVVFDVTSEQSLENTANWAQLFKQSVTSDVPAILFGNKTDLKARRRVNSERGNEVAQRLNMTYMEGSAKENEGVKDIFMNLIKNITSQR